MFIMGMNTYILTSGKMRTAKSGSAGAEDKNDQGTKHL